ncbi:hypothetical protein IFM89_012286 [Coptis chinensis]|uniref:Kinesin motor domain-containing protein n=2 Tax=Coptis chinensis TaxID=261450 RepID=A0A835HA56_9MAGN|nr:hypothetical protein IFM89_012286 [Coptis chinensis]
MERIYVTVRPRPLSTEDAKSSPWRISGNSISISNQSTKFDFDRIFEEDCKTEEVYEARTKDIVSAAVRGFNGTVFAYGQTNSGKTHTMRGSAVEPGVIRLAIRDLFDIIQEDLDREFLLRMSYMEIYNEEINDLLAPEHRKLQIHENLERGIFVAGLKEEIVATPEQVLDLMEFGESHRHIGETNMNVYSSRSHTIFRMIIESRVKTEDDNVGASCDAVRVSVVNLVDLAGSERAAKTGAEGVRLKEGSHINKSLMTLGTVIKKLSEGVESQGGHVPYRDSKLTRILQPSLGGNANTAIICNITLAQIHADETKSSLQFASRALRVTNCARVNEILTDAALLKRQKKEIEELRARLQGSHAEHFGEEILNLRNTLLQSELERERIALELQEEKKAQALRERRLQEQAKKIENLSSMVLNSSVDENRFTHKKGKRRETWCPNVMSHDTRGKVLATTQLKSSAGEHIRPKRDMGLPLPFKDLVNEIESVKSENPQSNCTPGKYASNDLLEVCLLPDACSLLNVTNRRKPHTRKKNSLENGSEGLQTDYEELLVEFETQGITKDIEIECLTKRLAAAECHADMRSSSFSVCQLDGSTSHVDRIITSRESEAIVIIKQLQEQVKMLEIEKSSIQQNLDDVIELATKQNISAGEMYKEATLIVYSQHYNEYFFVLAAISAIYSNSSHVSIVIVVLKCCLVLYGGVCWLRNPILLVSAIDCVILDRVCVICEELLNARKDASMAQEELLFQASLQKIEENDAESDVELLMEVQEIVFEVEKSKNAIESISSVVDELFKSFAAVSDILLELKSFPCQCSGNLKTIMCSHEKICNFMERKISELETNESTMHRQSVDLSKQIQELQHNLNESERILMERCQQHDLEKVDLHLLIENLEKETMCLSSTSLTREKETLRKELEKAKIKLKETEFKLKNAIQDKTKLEGEKAQAEREMKKLHGQKTLLERDISKRDSLVGKRRESKAFDSNKARVNSFQCEQALQGEYKKLEVVAFEMETTIASLEEQLAASNGEKEEAFFRNDILVSELEETLNKLSTTSYELKMLQEEFSSIQLTDALLELEEEKAIWLTKEKASIESIAEKAKLSNAELAVLSKELQEVRVELESCNEESKLLREKLVLSVENAEYERKCRCDLKIEVLIMERDKLLAQNEEQQRHMVEVEIHTKHSEDLYLKAKAHIEELTARISSVEAKKMHSDTVHTTNERAKLRMRLRGTQAKLDAFRGRHKEAIDEIGYMNKKYKEASTKLKEQLASCGIEILQLKKDLVSRDR